ncbi:hypothetical protein G6F57_014267 [Rhizopus arrhizus]|nr:hypothetical protein G6F57_014267 [Rhizopus arrhizus]KAG1586351.1 hypothetical protein G6F46_014792 [Rhizopus delemar]
MKRLLPLLLILPLAGFRPAPPPPPAYQGGPVRMALVDRDRGTELRSYPAEGQRWSAAGAGGAVGGRHQRHFRRRCRSLADRLRAQPRPARRHHRLAQEPG